MKRHEDAIMGGFVGGGSRLKKRGADGGKGGAEGGMHGEGICGGKGTGGGGAGGNMKRSPQSEQSCPIPHTL